MLSSQVSENPWLTQQSYSALVYLGSHSLHASIAGPLPCNGEPVIIIIHGSGTIGSASWIAVQDLVKEFARIVIFDRAGTGKSKAYEAPDRARQPRGRSNRRDWMLEEAVEDTEAVVRAMELSKPWVCVGQSWGGPVAMQFVRRNLRDVGGCVLVDCLHGVQGEIWGQRTTSKGLWGYLKRLWEERRGSAVEPLFGDRPLSVISGNMEKDWAGEENNSDKNGGQAIVKDQNAKERMGAMRQVIDDFQREQLELSSRHRYFKAALSGHNVQEDQPEIVSEAIRWLVEELKKGAG